MIYSVHGCLEKLGLGNILEYINEGALQHSYHAKQIRHFLHMCITIFSSISNSSLLVIWNNYYYYTLKIKFL